MIHDVHFLVINFALVYAIQLLIMNHDVQLLMINYSDMQYKLVNDTLFSDM